MRAKIYDLLNNSKQNVKFRSSSRIRLICVVLLITPNVWRTNESKWFNEINFRVTQVTCYFTNRSKNFTHPECEKHFYPKEPPSSTEINLAAALELTDLSAISSICFCMLVLSLLVFFSEIVFFHTYRIVKYR